MVSWKEKAPEDVQRMSPVLHLYLVLPHLFFSGKLLASTLYFKDVDGALLPSVKIQIFPGPAFRSWSEIELAKSSPLVNVSQALRQEMVLASQVW